MGKKEKEVNEKLIEEAKALQRMARELKEEGKRLFFL